MAILEILKTQAKEEIISALNEIIKNHPGGEAFFDHMDDYLINQASPLVYKTIFTIIGNRTLVLSGGFGKRIADGIDSGEFPKRPYHLFKGGIRSGVSPVLIRSRANFEGESVFVDDTIYGGATYFKIKDFINALAGKNYLTNCFAVYDGSPVKREEVESIFRYYDYHQVKSNFVF